MLVRKLEFKEGTPAERIDRAEQYFDRLGKLRGSYEENGKSYLVVTFEDEADFLAFLVSLNPGKADIKEG